MSQWKKIIKPNQASLFLGERIKQCRLACNMTPLELGKAINMKMQHIDSYEKGGFVPLPIIEKLATAFGDPVQKKIIRRISFLRKLEQEGKGEQPELQDWYNLAFPVPHNEGEESSSE